MRLPEEFQEAVEASSPYTNWRVARYREGQTFPAHPDQADSVMVERKERARQRFTSTHTLHTLLINLTQPNRDFQGGATRFFLDGEWTINLSTLRICGCNGCQFCSICFFLKGYIVC